MSKRGREWYALAATEIAAQNPPKLDGQVVIYVELAAPTRRSFDPDNKTKVLFDALVKAGVIEDDSNRIIRLHWVDSAGEGFRGARLTIRKVHNEPDTTISTEATGIGGDTPTDSEWWKAYQAFLVAFWYA